MSTALWIGGLVLVVLSVLVAAWRLRRAARTVERILLEETECTAERETRPVACAADDRCPPGE